MADELPEPPPAEPHPIVERLRAAMPDAVEEILPDPPVPIVRVKPERIVEVCRFLKDDPACQMTLLSDLCGVDRIGLGQSGARFEVVYQLFSLEHRRRIRLKAEVADGGEIATVSGVWRTANWHEREAYDMFGIRFAGHPDPRRILMPEEFDAFPLRKDFPLEGRAQDHGYWRQPADDQRDGAND